ncbi:TFIIB-type zinc ribbon-containing protein [Prauserella cavernicola]|uniref:Zf-TFIIB domain-containing protein n=1 Tax=Prauserella cavernicola TaxID=2800127 RepID=A0A934QQJ3_9PSEU|nr:zf-TFIIB domain-containing protein [Prauserella cavernicola]MBK1784248.1 zf-TFIIB domain-containing protein [Prauserella cavernicola]
MICPKCQNSMSTVDKGGIHIEQCRGCGGIFLDRGELEQIISAENAYYGGPGGAPPPYQGSRGHAPTQHYADSPRGYRGGPGGHGGRHQDSPRPYGGHGGKSGYRDSPRPYGGHGGHSGHGGYRDSPRPYGGHGHGKGHRKRSFIENLFG